VTENQKDARAILIACIAAVLCIAVIIILHMAGLETWLAIGFGLVAWAECIFVCTVAASLPPVRMDL